MTNIQRKPMAMNHRAKIVSNQQKKNALPVAGVLAIVLLLLTFSTSAAAPERSTQGEIPWPPFWFELLPSYNEGKITYRLDVASRIDQQLSDLTIRIPIPPGTRFLETGTPPGTTAEFDGQEITFLTVALDKYLGETLFTVEVTAPAQTVFTTQPWISWQGEFPGEYLAEPVSIDITRLPLNWADTTRSRLQLGVGATVTGDTITYNIYPRAIDRERMWDLKINIELPQNVTFLTADAPASFTTGFDGRKILFLTIELPRQTEIGPLVFQVSTANMKDSALTLPIQATWKNGDRDPLPGTPVDTAKNYTQTIKEPPAPAQENIIIETVIPKIRQPQQIVFDPIGDVPLSNYDLSSIVFQQNGFPLTVTFNIAGEMEPIGHPVSYTLLIDDDNNHETGQPLDNLGADYRLSYNHQTGTAFIVPWDAGQNDWDWSQVTNLGILINSHSVTLVVPFNFEVINSRFAWTALVSNETQTYTTELPRDWITNDEFPSLTQYHSAGQTIPIQGKLAVPLRNGQDLYDVHIFSLPEGEELDRIINAHQPDFRFDGQRLLINHIGNSGESEYQYDLSDGQSGTFIFRNYDTLGNIQEYDLTTETELEVGGEAQNSHPFYSPTGRGLVYGTAKSNTFDTQPGNIFVQAEITFLCREIDPACQNRLPGPSGRIQGDYPLWSRNNLIIYKGCDDDGADSTGCGIYLVGYRPTQDKNPIPVQLTPESSDIPADTQSNLVAFTSHRDGDWEAYIMDLAGENVKNLSQSPNSNDGLPAISPDGNWIAFVSDRGSRWAIWVAPVSGGPALKLFNLPESTPWGDNDPTWLDERISWGRF